MWRLFGRLSSFFGSGARMSFTVDELTAVSSELIHELRTAGTDKGQKEKLLQKYFSDLSSSGATQVKIDDFPKELEWINVTKPLSFNKELKGKLVLLDFFTYCCINCMHVLPKLRLLEQEFSTADGFVVIGVHSAKFTNEKQLENIESAVRRYEISHAVVNDKNFKFWNKLECSCWPSFYFISPLGNPILISLGEGNYEVLRSFIKFALKYYEKDLDRTSLSDVIKPDERAGGTLSYPGKVAVDPSGLKIAISDTNNHRIIIATTSGQVLHIIGTKNEPGLADGLFSEAKFNAPQGICFGHDFIYVADTENHALRRIDLKEEKVVTLVGNGKQGSDYKGGKEGPEQEISSPWDVQIYEKVLYLAMAGTHQIWGYPLENVTLWGRELEKGKCYALVGSGKEENKNNPRPHLAGLAQPSGFCVDSNGVLYFADSESSAVRRVQIGKNGAVEGVVGGHLNPSNLFAFGDVDGVGNEAKLQHPLDVAFCPEDQMVYVVDSYNHKIKKIDASKKTVTTVNLDNDIKLNEPGGISGCKNLLYIADTNNHCLRVYDVSKNEISTLDIEEASPETKIVDNLSEEEKVVEVNPVGNIRFEIELVLPQDVYLTPNAPSAWTILLNDDKMVVQGNEFSLNPSWSIDVEHSSSISAKCRLFLCSGGTCFVKEHSFRVKLKTDETAPKTVHHKISHKMT